MQSIPVLICEGCDDSLIAQSLQLQRELAFSAFLSVCISHFRHFSQVWECVLHPLLQFNLVAKQFICGKGSLRPRKQKAEKTHLAQKSLKAKITLHPTFNVFVGIAQTKLQKKQAKINFLCLISKNLCIHTAWERLLVEKWIAPRIFCIHNLIPKYVAPFLNDVASIM